MASLLLHGSSELFFNDTPRITPEKQSTRVTLHRTLHRGAVYWFSKTSIGPIGAKRYKRDPSNTIRISLDHTTLFCSMYKTILKLIWVQYTISYYISFIGLNRTELD